MTTDVKPDILLGVQTGNGIPHDRYNIRGIAHAHTNKKDDIFMQRRLYIDEAHTALEISARDFEIPLCHTPLLRSFFYSSLSYGYSRPNKNKIYKIH